PGETRSVVATRCLRRRPVLGTGPCCGCGCGCGCGCSEPPSVGNGSQELGATNKMSTRDNERDLNPHSTDGIETDAVEPTDTESGVQPLRDHDRGQDRDQD